VSEVDDKGNVLSTFTDTSLSPQHLATDNTGHQLCGLFRWYLCLNTKSATKINAYYEYDASIQNW